MPAMMAQPGGARAEMTAPDRWTRPNANQRRALRTYQRVWDLHLRLKRLRDAYWAASGTADPRKSMEAIVGKDPAIDDRLYSWLKRYDPRKGGCGCSSMETAKPMGKPLIGGGEWDESKHPRGQPGNPGQFAEKEGGGKAERRKGPYKVARAADRPVLRDAQRAGDAIKEEMRTDGDRVILDVLDGADLAQAAPSAAWDALLDRADPGDAALFRAVLDGKASALGAHGVTAFYAMATLASEAAADDPSIKPAEAALDTARLEAREAGREATNKVALHAYRQAASFWRGTTQLEALNLVWYGEWGAKAPEATTTSGAATCFSADPVTANAFSDGIILEVDGAAMRALANGEWDAGSPASVDPDTRHAGNRKEAGGGEGPPDWKWLQHHMAGNLESRAAHGTPLSALPLKAIHADARLVEGNDSVLEPLSRIAPVYLHDGPLRGDLAPTAPREVGR